MKINHKKLYGIAALCFCAAYLFTYALHHIASYVAESSFPLYVDITVNRVTYFLLPLLATTVMLVASGRIGFARSVLLGAPLLLTRAVYFIPYFYMVNITGGFGYDTPEALGVALLLSLGDSAIAFAVCVIVLLFIRFMLRRLSHGKELSALIEEPAMKDPKAPIDIAIRTVSLAASAYFLIREIIDAAIFLSESFSTVRPGEILYITYLFLLDASLFFVHYFVISFVKNACSSRLLSDEGTKSA